jgi:hypothetical protein
MGNRQRGSKIGPKRGWIIDRMRPALGRQAGDGVPACVSNITHQNVENPERSGVRSYRGSRCCGRKRPTWRPLGKDREGVPLAIRAHKRARFARILAWLGESSDVTYPSLREGGLGYWRSFEATRCCQQNRAESSKLKSWLPKNMVFEIVLSRFLNVSAGQQQQRFRGLSRAS